MGQNAPCPCPKCCLHVCKCCFPSEARELIEGAELSSVGPSADLLKVVGDGDPFRGLSVHFLGGKFMELFHLNENSTEKVYHIEPRVRELSGAPLVCPRDGSPGCALVDVAPDNFAGRANIMISYGWGYNVIDIVGALQSYCDRHNKYPKKVIVWCCFYCINQHRVKESQAKGISVPFAQFEATFKERVQGIGRVVCLLAPWNDPLYVQRVWCVFELYTAVTNPGVQFELILPPKEETHFERTIAMEGLDKIWECLTGLNVQNAKASVDDDRRTILNLVSTGPGTDFVNRTVQKLLRAWFAEIVVESLTSKMKQKNAEEEEATAIVSTAVNAVEFWHLCGGERSKVAAFSNSVLEFCEGTIGPDSKSYNLAASSVAHMAMLHSDFDKAIRMYRQILEFEEKALGEDTKEYGATMYDLGWAWCSKGNHREAVQVLKKARFIQEKVIGKNDVAFGRTVRDMGEAMIELGEFDDAAEAYEEAVPSLESAVGRHHPDTSIALKHQARLFVLRGDPLKAIDQLAEVGAQEEATLGANSCDHAITLLILADALAADNKLNRALYICDGCLDTFNATIGRKTKFGLWALCSRGRILLKLARFSQAKASFEESLSIAEEISGKDSSRCKTLRKEIDELNLQEESADVAKTAAQLAVDPWGEMDEENPLLWEFKRLDENHDGLVEFGKVIKMVKRLLKRDLDENELQRLATAAKVPKDSTTRTINFGQFQSLGHSQGLDESSVGDSFMEQVNKVTSDHFDLIRSGGSSSDSFSSRIGASMHSDQDHRRSTTRSICELSLLSSTGLSSITPGELE